MKIKSLEMTNFRSFKSLKVDLNDRLNVFVGINGVGKSSILDCIAILLSRFIDKFAVSRGKGPSFGDNDIANGEKNLAAELFIVENGLEASWKIIKSLKAIKKTESLSFMNMVTLEEKIRSHIDKESDYSLPLCVYYGVNRNIYDVSVSIRKNHDFSQLTAYDQALTGNHNDFKLFFEWFRDREDYENEIVRENRSYHDQQLAAIRSAIETFTGFSELKVKRETPRLEVKKGDQLFDLRQLSEGEKCFLALIGDLARRLAIANPGMPDPLKGEGVVLIDEIDLHLHPSWQSIVIPKLSKVFPSCQFIISTHSPVVINQVKPEDLFVLTNKSGYSELVRPEESYGKNADRVLEDIMGVSARPIHIENELSLLFEKIERKDLPNAKKQLSHLRGEIKNDPELLRAEMLIRRKEILGK